MITNISGSSSYFNGSIISYSNQSKIELLGVDEEIINKKNDYEDDWKLLRRDKVFNSNYYEKIFELLK